MLLLRRYRPTDTLFLTGVQWAKNVETIVTTEVWANGYMRCEEEGECGKNEYKNHYISPWLDSSTEDSTTVIVNTRFEWYI